MARFRGRDGFIYRRYADGSVVRSGSTRDEDRIADPAPVPAATHIPPHPPFPGGPSDTSLLVRYQNHVARHLWDGQVSKSMTFLW